MQSAMQAGRIRVLLGTTAKMDVGLNVQSWLKAEIHVDMPQRLDRAISFTRHRNKQRRIS